MANQVKKFGFLSFAKKIKFYDPIQIPMVLPAAIFERRSHLYLRIHTLTSPQLSPLNFSERLGKRTLGTSPSAAAQPPWKQPTEPANTGGRSEKSRAEAGARRGEQ